MCWPGWTGARLSWLADEAADCYCADNGRPGIDPEVAVRLMLAGLLLGIVHDRRLMRESQVNLTIRWFCDVTTVCTSACRTIRA
jgi:transposase